MPDILTITLNPAVDLATSVERVAPGHKLYCKTPRIDPGGGGVNVARAIRLLGGQAKALLTVGGANGARLLEMLQAEDVPTQPVPVSGETRESFAVTDETTGEQYRFSVPGDTLAKSDSAELLTTISTAVSRDGFVVLSGGVAPGLGDGFALMIQQAIAPATDRLVVDISKSALTHLIGHVTSPVLLLRLDQREAELEAGHALSTIAETVAFAETLIQRGVAQIVATGRRHEGSLLVTRDARYFCRTPQVPVLSKIGAGDAFVGGITLSLARGGALDLALRWGVAAACATMGTEGTGLCGRGETERLLPQCHVELV